MLSRTRGACIRSCRTRSACRTRGARGFKTSANLREVVIVSAVRTPFANFMGAMKDIPATKLGSISISTAIERAGLTPAHVEEVYMGNVIAAGIGQAPARQAALGAGCPVTTPCTTVNKVCASGMKSIMMAAQSIACGARDIMVAGGMESMSNVPMYENRSLPIYGNRMIQDGILNDGLMDAYTPGLHMGNCGEDTASAMSISRAAQDAYSVQSYQRSAAAYQSGILSAELVNVPTPTRQNPDLVVDQDTEFSNVKFDKIPTLRTVFSKEGTITAANSSKISDGAAACVLMAAETAKELGITPLARILTMADSAGEPIKFPIAPVRAMELALLHLGLKMGDIQRVEVNEAFAVVALACQEMLDIPDDIYNPNGGAISLGHPIGASVHRVDARDIITVFSESGLPPANEEIGESDMEPIISDVCLMAERNADTTTVSCTDLILTWILQLFDSNFAGVVTVKQFTTGLVVLGSGRLVDKLKYMFDMCKGSDGLLSQQGFTGLLTDLLLIPCSVFEEDIYGHSNLVLSALFDCFNQLGHEREKISVDEFLQWCTHAPYTLSWLFTLHRVMCSEYAVNLNACANCGNAPFLGFRYAALYSYNYVICQDCAWTGNTEGEFEFREYGALGQCVNITVTPKPTTNRSSSCLSLPGSSLLANMQQSLDARFETLQGYCKRLEPKSPSRFLKLSDQLEEVEDSTEALLGECEDRASKLNKDFIALSRDHSEIMKLERKSHLNSIENLQVWKKRDDLFSRLTVWMSRRNDLYVKQETILQEYKVEVPSLKYRKCSALGSVRSISSTSSTGSTNKLKGSMNGLDNLLNTKVSVEESVLVLSKLSLIINNVLLQKSIAASPQLNASPQLHSIKRMSRDSPPPSPLSFENKAARQSNGVHFGSSKENVSSNLPLSNLPLSNLPLSNLPLSQDETAATNDALQEFETVMNDMMEQENLTSTEHKIISIDPDTKHSETKHSDPDTKHSSDSDSIKHSDSKLPDIPELKVPDSEVPDSEVPDCIVKHGSAESLPGASPDFAESLSAEENSVTPQPEYLNPARSPEDFQSGEVPGEEGHLEEGDLEGEEDVSKDGTLTKPVIDNPAAAHPNHAADTTADTTVRAPHNAPDTTARAPHNAATSGQLIKLNPAIRPDNFAKEQHASSFVKQRIEAPEKKVEEKTEEISEDWESDGSWETEEENTTNTEHSGPPESLNITDVVSEPECDPPEPGKPPVPPPRNLLSPQGVSRRATSLKTKDTNDPKMEELRKVTRASSSVHSKNKPEPERRLSGIPIKTPSLSSSPSNTPPPRNISRIPTPKLYAQSPEARRTSGLKQPSPASSSKPTPTKTLSKSNKTPFKGPIVYEGDSDSETTTSSSSDESRGKKSKFTRARSARFARTKLAAPNRNAASFKAKKSVKPPTELGFFNDFAE